MELDAEVGSATANAYLDVEEADDYFESRPHSGTWEDADEEDKAGALIWATSLIDAHVCWVGAAAGESQALAWPRAGMVNRNGFPLSSLAVPSELKFMAAELAQMLLRADRMVESKAAAAGLTKLKAGSVELGFRDDIKTTPVPDTILAMLPKAWLCPDVTSVPFIFEVV